MAEFHALFILSVLIALYFAPTIVALTRGHRQSIAILVLNTLLGWTLLGWAVALVWAFVRERESAEA